MPCVADTEKEREMDSEKLLDGVPRVSEADRDVEGLGRVAVAVRACETLGDAV